MFIRGFNSVLAKVLGCCVRVKSPPWHRLRSRFHLAAAEANAEANRSHPGSETPPAVWRSQGADRSTRIESGTRIEVEVGAKRRQEHPKGAVTLMWCEEL